MQSRLITSANGGIRDCSSGQFFSGATGSASECGFQESRVGNCPGVIGSGMSLLPAARPRLRATWATPESSNRLALRAGLRADRSAAAAILRAGEKFLELLLQAFQLDDAGFDGFLLNNGSLLNWVFFDSHPRQAGQQLGFAAAARREDERRILLRREGHGPGGRIGPRGESRAAARRIAGRRNVDEAPPCQPMTTARSSGGLGGGCCSTATISPPRGRR